MTFNLRLEMIAAGFLTVVSEALTIYTLLALLGISPLIVLFVLPIFWFVQWVVSPYLVGRNTFEVTPYDPTFGWVYHLVSKVAVESRVKPPKVYVADVGYPNAFAHGNYITGKRVAITIPLLNILTPQELRAVVAHEIGHIKHNHVEIGMALGLIPTALSYVSTLLMYAGYFLLFLAGDEVELAMALASLALGGFLLVVTFFLQIFVLWFNRLRESYADYHSVSLLGKGSLNLATALAKIQIYMQKVRLDPFTGIIVTTAPVRVDNTEPYLLVQEWLRKKVSLLTDFLSTHPHPAKRVQMIYSLIGG